MTTTILSTHLLTREFGNGCGIRDLSLSLSEGQTYGFLGRNGAGKTTAILTVMGLHYPQKGALTLFGETVKATPARLKERIGYVPQHQSFFPHLTVRETGSFVRAFFPTWDDGEFERLVKLFALPKARKCRDLSGGMQVKLSVALALAHRPPLLILDEPTAGLDPIARRELLDIFVSEIKPRGQTILFSSHILDDIERTCSHLGVIDGGTLIFEGEYEALLGSCPGQGLEECYLSLLRREGRIA